MPKDPMERPDYRGEVGGPCPDCRERFGIETPTVARSQQNTGKLYFGCPNFDPPTSADSMDAEMWYPNKKQWPVIWTAFLMAAILFIGGVSNDESGAIAASFCVLVLGALLVWKLSSTD